MLSVNLIMDILVLGIVGFGAYRGYQDGVLSEIVGILHFVIAFGLSFKVLSIIFGLVSEYIFRFDVNLFPELVFATSVAAAFILLATLGQYLKTEIEFDFPGAWDNVIGAVVGVLKYVVAMSFFFWMISGLGSFTDTIRRDSISFRVIEPIAFTLVGVKNDAEMSGAIMRFIGGR